jgi:hypothetical protein
MCECECEREEMRESDRKREQDACTHVVLMGRAQQQPLHNLGRPGCPRWGTHGIAQYGAAGKVGDEARGPGAEGEGERDGRRASPHPHPHKHTHTLTHCAMMRCTIVRQARRAASCCGRAIASAIAGPHELATAI